jgi:hypothetical protein
LTLQLVAMACLIARTIKSLFEHGRSSRIGRRVKENGGKGRHMLLRPQLCKRNKSELTKIASTVSNKSPRRIRSSPHHHQRACLLRRH